MCPAVYLFLTRHDPCNGVRVGWCHLRLLRLLWKYYVSVEITCLYCTMFCSDIFWLCTGMLNSAELKITTQCFLRPISVHCNMRRWTLCQRFVCQICTPQSPKLALLQHILLWDILHQNAKFSGTQNHNSVFFATNLSSLQPAALDVAS